MSEQTVTKRRRRPTPGDAVGRFSVTADEERMLLARRAYHEAVNDERIAHAAVIAATERMHEAEQVAKQANARSHERRTELIEVINLMKPADEDTEP